MIKPLRLLAVMFAFSGVGQGALAQSDGIETRALRPVMSEFVSTDPVVKRQYSGVIRGQDVTALAFQTSGRLATLDVAAGDRVVNGQVLASLDQITLAQDVAVAEAAVSGVQAQAEFAQSQYERVSALVERNVATTAQLEAARANRDATAAQLESVRANLAQATEAARYGSLVAPRDGIVLSTSVDPGTLVSPGVSVMEIADPMGREAIIDVPASVAAIMPEGAGFVVRHRSGGVAPVMARLSVIEPVADTSLETRRLRLMLIAPPEDYRIGTLITAAYNRGADPAMTLPISAIAGTQDSPGVWRVSPDRVVTFVPVTLGDSVGDRVVITTGLSENDEIVVRGVHALEDGQKVGERLE
jgi:membrane fusion protein, multidrug efflux system